ncbi:hypothetical protein CTheo_4102 [Ceratobasidium theobromae]|uniref:Uncharacterized protein n=1 Tax=Ceratobasidium theobromae TaxID=1582974 RepID=A0A5N5QL11_9AGAM|nr:hypothetical protein CTheo_4102 [Ceratobasidium theobromae]
MSHTNDSKTPPSNDYLFAINNSANITYCPTILLKNIQNHPRAVDSIAEIFVTMLSYYKRNGGVEHEFIVARIEDSKHCNFIKIDRCLPEAVAPANPPGLPEEGHSPGSSVQDGLDQPPIVRRPRLTSYTSSSESHISGDQRAHDCIHVSGSGKLEALINTGGGSRCLATVRFHGGAQPQPTIEDILVLADVISLRKPCYDLLKAQCYWYAYTFWSVLQMRFKAAADWPKEIVGAGRNKVVPWIEFHKHDLQTKGQINTDEALARDFASIAANYIVALATSTEKTKENQKTIGLRARDAQDAARDARDAAREAEIKLLKQQLEYFRSLKTRD